MTCGWEAEPGEGRGEVDGLARRTQYHAVIVAHERSGSMNATVPCYLPIEEIRVVGSLLEPFPGDVAAHATGQRSPEHGLVVPKILDFDEASSTFTWER